MAVQPFPVPLTSLAPGGSLIYQSATGASIDAPGEVESFTIGLDAGQSISVAVDPNATLDAAVSIRDPQGNILATASANGVGLDELIHTVATTTAGTYTVVVSALGGTTGGFGVTLVLNADIETEAHGLATNDSPATAHNLNGSFVGLGLGGASRGAVVGVLPSSVGGTFLDGEDFETGTLDGQWTTSSSQVGGRIQVSNAYGAATGSYAILMDRTPAGTSNLNEAIWTVDLTGLTQATLSFSHRDFADEETSIPLSFVGSANGDGVAISADGVTWRRVLNTTNVTTGTWATVTIDLDAEAAAAGMALGANFRIKFQQYDDNPLTTDGRGYDNIRILTPAPPEDWYRFELSGGESASVALASQTPGTAAVELYAGDGTTLLASGVGAASTMRVIDDFVAPGGGGSSPFYLRVHGSDAAYGLVVTREADFDVEPNNGLAPDAQDISLAGIVLGELSGGSPGPNIDVGLIQETPPWGSSSNTNIAAELGYTVTLIPSASLLTTDLSQFEMIVLAGDQSSTVYSNVATQLSALEAYVRNGGVYVVNYAAGSLTTPYSYDVLPGANGLVVIGATGTDVNVLDPTSGLITGPGGTITDTNLDGGTSSTHGYTTSSLPAGANAVLSTGTSSQIVAFDYPFDGGHVVVHTMPVEYHNGGPHGIGQVFHRNLFHFAASMASEAGDFYRVAVHAGDQLAIQTRLPAAGPGEFVNNLDIAIELYDPSGNLVASSASGSLNYGALSTGDYTVRLLNENDTEGEYVLRVSGHTGSLPPFAVAASNPADGAAFQIAPTQIAVDLSDEMLLSSISAADLSIDGTPALGVTIVDQDSLVFNLPPLADGPHTLAIAQGAIVDLQGQPLEPFSIQVAVDATGPRVVASSILEGGVVEAGSLSFSVTFDEPLAESDLDASDVQLTGLLSGFLVPTLFHYDANSATLTLHYAGLAEDDYTLTLLSSPFGFRDLAGNPLDGERDPLTTVPSGDGFAGGDFVLHFIAETTDGVFPTPFVPAGPLGSLIYTSSASGRILPAADVDQFSVELDAGQRLSLVVAAEFRAAVTVLGPDSLPLASASAAATGDDVLVEGVPVGVAGRYTVRIESLGGTSGDYSIDAVLNAVAEREAHGGPTNNGPVEAQNLDTAFFTLPDGNSQYAAVTGTVALTAGLLFEDTFPTTFFDPTKWLVVSSATIDGLGIAEPSEPYSARLNGNPVGGDSMESVVIDLSGQSAATLSYWFEQTGGGETVDAGEDLILWYLNAGGVWVELERQLGSGPNMGAYQFREVALPTDALHANFRFRFTNIATSGNFDDWFVDNVSVTGDMVVPDAGDWYRFSLADGQSATIALATGGPVSVELFDATGTVKLASSTSAANWTQVIENFVDTTSDGAATSYLLQVLGSNLEYQLSVTRDANLDFELNDSSELAQDIGGINRVLGHSSVGDEDWYQISVNNGDQLTIGTTAPASGPFEFVNPLGTGLTGGVVITEVVDGTLADGNPKFVEITNTSSAPYTFTAGGLIVQSNGSTDRVVDIDLGGVTILPGQSFVIAATANDGQTVFEATYGFAADRYADAFLGDGNDRFLLTDTDDGSHIVDIFGEIDTNGTGRPWEYTDSYAYRHALAVTPVGAAYQAADWYLAGVNALETGNDVSEAVLLQTLTTPGSHEFVAERTPLVRVELYDPAGNLVESGLADLNHLATHTGVYRVRVMAIDSSGEYLLTVGGATGLNQPPQVVATDPLDGALTNQFPATYTVTFSEPLLEGTIDAGDLLINGQPAATGVTQVDPFTYRFDLNPAINVGDGLYTIELPAGAVQDLSGRANETFTASFTHDATGPRVLNVLFNGASLPLGGNLLAGNLTIDVFFSEDLREETMSGQLGPEDVLLTNTLTGNAIAPASMTYDAATNKASLTFTDIDESVYRLTLLSADGAFEDEAGNDLDGEPSGPSVIGTPSGNGAPGGNFVVQFQTDAIGARDVEPFERLRPLGSFMAVSAGNVGVIGSPGDVDDFEIYVQQGQILSAILTPDQPSANLFLSLVGVAGPVFSIAPGQPVILGPELIPISGPVTLRVFGNTTTSYSLDVYANSALELAVGDSADGHELALDDARLALGSGRWGAVGEIAAIPSLSTVYTQDFNLNAGNFVFNNTTYGSGNGLWHRSTGRQADGLPNHSPASSLYFGQNEGPLGNGNYHTGTATAGTATSPGIALPNAEVVLLSLNHFLATDGVLGRDIAEIAISTGGGFVTVASTADGSLAHHTNGHWAPLTIDLSQFAGQTVSVQFRFDSITALQNQFEGWYIDDIRIQAANSYLADIDEYTIDLSSYVGRPLDIAVASQSGGSMSDASVELLGPDGTTVLATASANPLGVTASNFEQATLSYVPLLPGVYTIRVISDDPGHYGVLVTESLPIEVEPNDNVAGGLRPLGPNSALGHLGDGSGGGSASRLFAVVATTSEVVEYDPMTGAELNRFALPEPATGQPDGLGFNGTSLFYAEGPAFGGSGILYEIDPDTGAVLDADPFANVGLSSGVCGLGAYGGYVFAIDTLTSQVFFIDTAADQVIGSVIVPTQTRGGAAGAGERGSLYVNSFLNDLIYEVDPDSGQVINSFGAPGGQIEGLAYVNGSLFAGDGPTRQIYRLDPDTGAVLSSWTATGNLSALAGDDPSGAPPNFQGGPATGQGPLPEVLGSKEFYGEIPAAALTAFRPDGMSLKEMIHQLQANGFQGNGNGDSLSTAASPNPNALIVVSESEPNDSTATADFVPLGFGLGQDAAIDVAGSVGPGGTTTIIFPQEDDGSIPLATQTALTFGSRVRADATIGDGPFGATSGDYDWYAIPNVAVGNNIIVDIDATSIGSSLDSFIGIYNSAGTLLAANDDFDGLDSYLSYTASTAGPYYVVVRGYGGGFQSDPFNSGSGTGRASVGFYRITIGLGAAGGSDIDYYRLSLTAGDILGVNVSGGGETLTLLNASSQLMIGSSQDITAIHPASSPLPGGGSAALSAVIPVTGDYYVGVSGTFGNYDLNLRLFRPVLESEFVGTRQTLFLDFDGASIDTSIFGGAGIRTLSPLTSFLGGWGLSLADENAVIDAIVASVEESLSADLRARGNNGDFAATGIPGQFDIQILNSRDHADPFGQPNVSRVIIGGTINELGISTIGIAETIDVGNFDTTESAVVLLDLLSADAGNPNSLNQYFRAPGVSIIDLIGVGVGNITAHEAGHFFANWHTNQNNASPNIMDQGGNLANTIGLVGPIWGDGDEIDVDFGPDTFVSNEGFTGIEDTLNAIAFGLSTGTFNSELVGPRVISVDPPAGVTHDLSITSIALVFSETITASSANDLSNYLLIEAGPNGILENGAGDDAVLPVSAVFDGDRRVDLVIGDGNTPLGFGKYRLTLDGDNSIEDLDGNPLNTITGPGGGKDFTHDFDVVFAVPEGGDFYRLDLLLGQRVTIETRTPWDDPLGTFANDLDPQLIVYNNFGVPLVFDSNSGVGNNARAEFIATAGGPYFVQVVAEAGAGEYLLDSQIENLVLLGDYNRDGQVDAGDYVRWRNMLGTPTSAYGAADGDGDGIVGSHDYTVWRTNYGATFATATDDQLVVISQPGGGGLTQTPFAEAAGDGQLNRLGINALADAAFETDAAQFIASPAKPSETVLPYGMADSRGGEASGVASAKRAASIRTILDSVAEDDLLQVIARRNAGRLPADELSFVALRNEGDDEARGASDEYFASLDRSPEFAGQLRFGLPL